MMSVCKLIFDFLKPVFAIHLNYKKKISLVFFLVAVVHLNLYAQSKSAADSMSLRNAILNGKTSFNMRYFFSQTTNEGALTDYYANAIGVGLRYQSNLYHGVQFGLGGYTHFNIGSSNLQLPDPTTGGINRYEIGLFDHTAPSSQKEFSRLEELYVKYHFKDAFVQAGRQFINTPLINQQDGRMRPTAVAGIWFEQSIKKKVKLQLGMLSGVSPRGTSKWYSGAESIGIYGQGVDVFGAPAHFRGHIKLPFIGVASITWKPITNLEYQAWDYHLPGLFNSTFHQVQHAQKAGKFVWSNSAQMMRQWALGEGGNEDQSMTYIAKGSKSMTFGFRSRFEFAKWHYSINYNRITAEGRYLFPREWGRDPFFTFMPRERNEGFGDVHAFVLKIENQDAASIFKKSGFSIGYFQLPDVKDFALNKYGMPSYLQANLDLRVKLEQLMHGLEGQLLFVCKYGIGEIYNNPKYQFNKVNMLLTNFVLNYHF